MNIKDRTLCLFRPPSRTAQTASAASSPASGGRPASARLNAVQFSKINTTFTVCFPPSSARRSPSLGEAVFRWAAILHRFHFAVKNFFSALKFFFIHLLSGLVPSGDGRIYQS
jgi:hypothetical protein